MKFSSDKIKKSKQEALDKITAFLDAPDVEAQFDKISGDYHSKDKFIVTWNDNWKGIPSEFAIDKCDSFYSSYSGSKAILATRSLFHEKQLKAYPSIEHALIDVAITKLISKKEDKVTFFNKYAVPFNERIKNKKEAETSGEV